MFCHRLWVTGLCRANLKPERRGLRYPGRRDIIVFSGWLRNNICRDCSPPGHWAAPTHASWKPGSEQLDIFLFKDNFPWSGSPSDVSGASGDLVSENHESGATETRAVLSQKVTIWKIKLVGQPSDKNIFENQLDKLARSLASQVYQAPILHKDYAPYFQHLDPNKVSHDRHDTVRAYSCEIGRTKGGIHNVTEPNRSI